MHSVDPVGLLQPRYRGASRFAAACACSGCVSGSVSHVRCSCGGTVGFRRVPLFALGALLCAPRHEPPGAAAPLARGGGRGSARGWRSCVSCDGGQGYLDYIKGLPLNEVRAYR